MRMILSSGNRVSLLEGAVIGAFSPNLHRNQVANSAYRPTLPGLTDIWTGRRTSDFSNRTMS